MSVISPFCTIHQNYFISIIVLFCNICIISFLKVQNSEFVSFTQDLSFFLLTKGDVIPIYTTYTIKTSSSTNNNGPNPAVTPKQPVSTDSTTRVGSTGRTTTTARPATTLDTISANTASSSTTRLSHTNSPATTNNMDTLSCSISPSNGTILDAFNIICQTNFPCSHCQYCFKTKSKYCFHL